MIIANKFINSNQFSHTKTMSVCYMLMNGVDGVDSDDYDNAQFISSAFDFN